VFCSVLEVVLELANRLATVRADTVMHSRASKVIGVQPESDLGLSHALQQARALSQDRRLLSILHRR